jgi:transposase
MNSISQIYVGIDIAKNDLNAHLHPINQSFRVSNTLEGVKKLIECFSGLDVQQIVCEATGGYETLMIKELKKSGPL